MGVILRLKKLVFLTLFFSLSCKSYGDTENRAVPSAFHLKAYESSDNFLKKRFNDLQNIPKKLFIFPSLSTVYFYLLDTSFKNAVQFFGIYSVFIIVGYGVYCSGKEGYIYFRKSMNNDNSNLKEGEALNIS